VEFIRLFFVFLCITLAFALLLGLYKPWWVLWWEDVQNRKKVILVYGIGILLSWDAYWMVKSWS